jgi:dTDP-4-dehydrorhamnose 3,5-epimerase
MRFISLPLSGAYRIELAHGEDNRGEFTRLLCARELEKIGHRKGIVQINQSRTLNRGTIRGLHFQYPPKAEVKFVTCTKGSAFDVMVDIRQDSPTFLHWYGEELSESNSRMLYLPEGFAHGFQTLQEDVEMLYFHTEFYDPDYEGGLRYDDKRLGIKWPLSVTEISKRDESIEALQKDFKGIRV